MSNQTNASAILDANTIPQSAPSIPTLERRSLKKNLTPEQVEALEKHFAIERKPRRKTKLALAEKLNIRPEILNWWFQFTRNKVKKAEAERAELRKQQYMQRMAMNRMNPTRVRLPPRDLNVQDLSK